MQNSKIEWVATVLGDGTAVPGYTWNGWIGCTKVSPGCLNCYAETLMDKRYHRVEWGKGNPRSRTSDLNWKQPLKWNRDCEKNGTRTKVFCASLADWLDDEVPLHWLAELIELILSTPNLDWLLLTKRPQNWKPRLKAIWLQDLVGAASRNVQSWLDGESLCNVWLGTTIENQAMVDERISDLLSIPAKVHFLSIEPLLESIAFPDNLAWYYCKDCDEMTEHSGFGSTDCAHCGVELEDLRQPSWIIVGGESGRGARPCQIDWMRSIVNQCKAAKVPVFVKQLGSNPVFSQVDHPTHFPYFHVTGKGGDIEEFPEDLRIREFPHQSHYSSMS